MTIEQKIKEIEEFFKSYGQRAACCKGCSPEIKKQNIKLGEALEVIRELQEELEIAEKAEINKNLTLTLSSVLAENTALKARLQPTPEQNQQEVIND